MSAEQIGLPGLCRLVRRIRRNGELGFEAAGEAEDGGPLAVALGLPDDVAVEEARGFGGEHVAVEIEVASVTVLRLAGEAEVVGVRLVFG